MTKCLSCRYISEENDACCAGPMLDIPLSEPIQFYDEYDGKVWYPHECYMIDELNDAEERWLENDLEMLIEELDSLRIQRKLKELQMYRNWLEIVKANVEGE